MAISIKCKYPAALPVNGRATRQKAACAACQSPPVYGQGHRRDNDFAHALPVYMLNCHSAAEALQYQVFSTELNQPYNIDR